MLDVSHVSDYVAWLVLVKLATVETMGVGPSRVPDITSMHDRWNSKISKTIIRAKYRSNFVVSTCEYDYWIEHIHT